MNATLGPLAGIEHEVLCLLPLSLILAQYKLIKNINYYYNYVKTLYLYTGKYKNFGHLVH